MTARDVRVSLGKAALILGAIATAWGLVTAGKTFVVGQLVTRAEWDVHQVRDSARWAKVEEKLNYTACRQDKPRIQCLP